METHVRPKKPLLHQILAACSVSERGLCVVKVPPCSPGCQQLSMLLVVIVGLWALGHRLGLVLLCWLLWPCCEMWSVSSIRSPDWVPLGDQTNGPIPGWLYHPGVARRGLVGARRSVWCLVVRVLGMRPRCLVVVVSQRCLPGSHSSLGCTLRKCDMLDSSGLCICQCSTLI